MADIQIQETASRHHPRDRILHPKSKFDFETKASQKQHFVWLPIVTIFLLLVAVAVFFIWRDTIHFPEPVYQPESSGPVWILVGVMLGLCVLSAFFLFYGHPSNIKIVIGVGSAGVVAVVITAISMWKLKYQDIDYCNDAVDTADFGNGNDSPYGFHRYAWAASGAFAFLAILISCKTLYDHSTHYNYPLQQRYVIRILMVVPIYAILTLASLLLYKHFFFGQVES